MEPLRANGKLETIKRLCQRINEIMFYAVNIGLIDANPAAKIKDAFEIPIKGQMPTINAQELPQFMQSLAMTRIELQTRCLIEWQFGMATHFQTKKLRGKCFLNSTGGK
ncbi:hypothetical protein A9G35_05450 [Gilliamella sp. Choc5-1]|nr:hypothetical protein [Gilliamella apicola]OCG46348.1 hypothetical protein A9G35_05450 [Gilliamella apicola]